jgi:phosphoribosylformimino-5-aminoimidazole carboxamide ribotide isomerase
VILIPAVDIRGGRAVRLRKGDFDAETVYASDPLEAARAWVEAGARALHVVDLDGARSGRPAAIEHLRRIATSAGVPVQYGGGLRSVDDAARAIDAGADRVVVGTAALSDERFLDAALETLGDRVVVSVDARGGRVALAGWVERTDSPTEAVVERLARRGVRRIVHTDVDRDGTLEGPSLDGIRAVHAAAGGASVICSGGVGSVDDLGAIAALALPRLEGVIAGKALYERRFTVAEGQAALDGAVARR